MLMLDAGVSAKACESLSVFCFPCQEWDCLDAARFFAERTNLQGIWLSVYVRRGIPGSEPIKTAGVLRWRWDRPWFLRAEARNLAEMLAHPDADPVGEGATLILHDDRGAAYTDHEIGSIECTPHAAIVKCSIEDTVQVSASKEGIELSSDTVMLTPGQAIELIGLLRRAIATVAREQKALGPATDYRPAPAKPREGSS